ncbi:hypothetical protein C8P67_10183 [Flavobacterium aquicola]|uniref:Uncharacterized protein n=1 Tax=Flavobacterium aquicola TaxID=1682742 RepID=A0A3E0ETM5_9FLAO|nr:hypothetical protein C8P67_10183 [Flavobacterium aquicola]
MDYKYNKVNRMFFDFYIQLENIKAVPHMRNSLY